MHKIHNKSLVFPPVQALEEGSGLCPRDGGYGDPEKENLYHVRPAYRRDDSVEGGNYLDHQSAHQRSEGEHLLLNLFSCS